MTHLGVVSGVGFFVFFTGFGVPVYKVPLIDSRTQVFEPKVCRYRYTIRMRSGGQSVGLRSLVR